VDKVRYLIEQGANPHDQKGRNIAMQAGVRSGSTDMVDYMLALGFSLEQPEHGNKWQHYAKEEAMFEYICRLNGETRETESSVKEVMLGPDAFSRAEALEVEKEVAGWRLHPERDELISAIRGGKLGKWSYRPH
jgi:hypothetical protein